MLAKAVDLHRAGKTEDAEALYETMLSSNPRDWAAMTLLGTLYAQRDDLKKGIALLDKAIGINPNHAEAHFNRGLAVQMQGNYEEALASYKKATMLDPSYNEAFWHKSLILLTLGQYEEGWKHYEWRWRRDRKGDMRSFRQPLWLGKESLQGKTLLIHAEQGFGDTLQFCRYLPLVATQAKHVIFECYASLVPLMQYNFPQVKVIPAMPDYPETSGLPAHDYQTPLLSLPHALGTTLANIPAKPYLQAEPEYLQKWQPILGERLGAKGRRIGLCWAGGQRPDKPYTLAVDARRSLNFMQLKPLLEINELTFVSLQLGPPKAQRDDDRVQDISSHIQSWSDTAAVIAQLDAVVSADTSVCHMAGAMGKPVLLLNRYDTCWRWLLDRDDSPWYPSLIQYRQKTPGDWEDVIARVKAALQALPPK